MEMSLILAMAATLHAATIHIEDHIVTDVCGQQVPSQACVEGVWSVWCEGLWLAFSIMALTWHVCRFLRGSYPYVPYLLRSHLELLLVREDPFNTTNFLC